MTRACSTRSISAWIGALCDTLSGGGLPPDYFALAEQSIRGPVPDVLALRLSADGVRPSGSAPALKADRVAVRHRHGRVVAVIEIVSPGNKAALSELRAFVEKVSDLIQQGVHVLVVNLFPPTPRDPAGIHKAIWDEFEDEDFTPPLDKPLTLAAYSADAVKTAYVEPVAVGDDLPDMPLFLEPVIYVPVPLEATYRTTWGVFPTALRGLLESPVPPHNGR